MQAVPKDKNNRESLAWTRGWIKSNIVIEKLIEYVENKLELRVYKIRLPDGRNTSVPTEFAAQFIAILDPGDHQRWFVLYF